jgi:hypothetical protein
MDTLSCRGCRGHCNQKGFISVMKGSVYCENQRGVAGSKRVQLINQIRQSRFFNRFNRYYKKARGRA